MNLWVYQDCWIYSQHSKINYSSIYQQQTFGKIKFWISFDALQWHSYQIICVKKTQNVPELYLENY